MSFQTRTQFVCICFVILFYIKFSLCRQAISLYARQRGPPLLAELQVLKRLEIKIAKNLMQWLLAPNINEPMSSSIRRTVQIYLEDLCTTNDYNKINACLDEEVNSVLGNPICTYKMIKRVKYLLWDLISLTPIFDSLSNKIIAQYLLREYNWPPQKYLKSSIDEILRLHHIYDLNVDQFADGWISNVRTNCTLNSFHCYDIAKIALKTEQFTSAIIWLELAKEKSLEDKKTSVAFIEFLLWNAIEMHNADFDDANKMKMEPFFFRRRIRHTPKNSKGVQKIRNIQYQKFKGKREKIYDKINYLGLCSRENFQTKKEKSVLFCWNEFKIHPSYTVGPMKIEFLSRNPDVIQIYEILSDKEIQKIISHSRPTAKWHKTDREVFLRKIKLLTGLEGIPVENSKSTSTKNNLSQEEKISTRSKSLDSSIATFLYYLSSIETGGDMAFTSLGVAAKPVKGSAVYWYNRYSDGSSDLSTNHIECPGLFGEHKASNKQIKLTDPYLVRKCNLKPKERFHIPVNNEFIPVPNLTLDTVGKDVVIPKHPLNDQSNLAKYSFLVPNSLKALIHLEWSMIYPKIKYLHETHRAQTSGTFREEFHENAKNVKMYLQDFEQSTLNVTGCLACSVVAVSKMVEKISHNILAAYRVVGRFHNYLQIWAGKKPSVENRLLRRIHSYLNKVYNISDGPLLSDWESAMFAIVHTQNVYNFSSRDIANGIMGGVNLQVTLQARDCFDLGQYALSLYFHESGLRWMEHALYQFQNNFDDTIDAEDVVEALEAAEIRLECRDNPSSTICQHSWKKQLKGENRDHIEESAKLREICRGNVQQIDADHSKLFCWYEREVHPSYKIGPIKAELHSMHPKLEIVQFYDIFNEKTSQMFTSFNYTDLKRPLPAGKFNSSFERQLVLAWGHQISSEATMVISELVERLTGLRAVNTGGTDIRLTAYTPGSHRATHVDSNSDDMLATFMFYFSDVEKGGETPFIFAETQVVPRKGSAIFWYNLYSSGDVDNTSDHGSCPIILGEKWVGVKWMHYKNQHHQQCNLKPNTIIEILVNGKTKYKEGYKLFS